MKELTLPDEAIVSKIYLVRGQKIMLDKDLAAIYSVEIKVFNQAVKRNIKRFPDDFMFRLTREEWNTLRQQFETSKKSATSLRSQIVTLDTGRGRLTKYLPYAFTEQGVVMPSSSAEQRRNQNHFCRAKRIDSPAESASGTNWL